MTNPCLPIAYLKAADLADSKAVPVYVQPNTGTVLTFRLGKSEKELPGLCLKKSTDGRILAVFRDDVEAAIQRRHFPRCKIVCAGGYDNAYDLSKPKRKTA